MFESEPEPSGAEPSVRVRGLTKFFSRSAPAALNSVTLNLYNGQISALLGLLCYYISIYYF